MSTSRRLDVAHLIGLGSVRSLERRLASYLGLRYAVATSSATTALLGLGLALDLRGGEFITSAYTYGATMASWMVLGNRAIFADVDPATLTLTPEAVQAAITPRARAILSVDADGVPCEVAALRRVADEYGLPLIVDSAQSFGASIDGRPAGYAAHAVVLSFTVGKLLDVAEGGAIATNDRDLYERLIWWTQHPMRQQRELGLRRTNEFGINGRMHPAAAVWADADFDVALSRVQARQDHALHTVRALNATGLTQPLPYSRGGICPNFFRLTAAWQRRARFAELRQRLAASGQQVHLSDERITPVYQKVACRAIQGTEAPTLTVLADQVRRRFRIRLDRSLIERTEAARESGQVERVSDQLYVAPNEFLDAQH